MSDINCNITEETIEINLTEETIEIDILGGVGIKGDTGSPVTPRVLTFDSSAEPSINTNNYDACNITALAVPITSMSTNLTGIPLNFQKLIIKITDNGDTKAINWGNKFKSMGVILPTSTVMSQSLIVGFIYDSLTSQWGCVAVVSG